MKRSAGIAIVYDNKLLLTHPTGAPWWATYGIPKGWVDAGEDVMDAAIRETSEEVGIKLSSTQLDSNLQSFYYMKDNEAYKQIYFYVANISSLDSIGLSGLVIPKAQLQLAEIDWAGFLSYDDAEKRIMPLQKSLLNLIK